MEERQLHLKWNGKGYEFFLHPLENNTSLDDMFLRQSVQQKKWKIICGFFMKIIQVVVLLKHSIIKKKVNLKEK